MIKTHSTPKDLKRRNVGTTIFKALTLTFLILYLIALFIPFLWGFLTTVKDSIDFRYNPFGLPETWHFENYLMVLKKFIVTYRTETSEITSSFGGMMVNAVLYAVVSSVVNMFTTYIMAYAASMFKFKFSRVIDAAVVVMMTLPTFGTLPSSIFIARALHVFDNFFGVAVIMNIAVVGMYYFIIQVAIKSVPKAFHESAKIDGAGNASILFRIYIPLTAGVICTIFILLFIGKWNDYQTPYIYLPSFPTAAYGLWKFREVTTGDVSHISFKLAACFMVMLPALGIFLVFHKNLMGAISLSEGVKE